MYLDFISLHSVKHITHHLHDGWRAVSILKHGLSTCGLLTRQSLFCALLNKARSSAFTFTISMPPWFHTYTTPQRQDCLLVLGKA